MAVDGSAPCHPCNRLVDAKRPTLRPGLANAFNNAVSTVTDMLGSSARNPTATEWVTVRAVSVTTRELKRDLPPTGAPIGLAVWSPCTKATISEGTLVARYTICAWVLTAEVMEAVTAGAVSVSQATQGRVVAPSIHVLVA